MDYELRTIADLMKVPIECRTLCFREIEYALALHELAYGEDSQTIGLEMIRWTDDGKREVQLQNEKGEGILTLRVTDEPAA